MTILPFYKPGDPFGEFSNFALSEIQVAGRTWITVEHYYQAQMFTDPIRAAPTPSAAFRMAREPHRQLRSDWASIKDSVMLEALRAKFAQHEDLAELLVSTGDAFLVEHTENDPYWGDGGDGSGENKLGKMLMQVREELGVRRVETQ